MTRQEWIDWSNSLYRKVGFQVLCKNDKETIRRLVDEKIDETTTKKGPGFGTQLREGYF